MFFWVLFFAARVWGGGCEGHEGFPLLGGKHKIPAATAAVTKLLKDYPALIPRACKDDATDLMAIASTWADDGKRSEKTGTWHYMAIRLGLKKGDPEEHGEPRGPPVNAGVRPARI